MTALPPSGGAEIAEPKQAQSKKAARKNPQRRKTEQAKRQAAPDQGTIVSTETIVRPVTGRTQTSPATIIRASQPTKASPPVQVTGARASTFTTVAPPSGQSKNVSATALAPAAIVTGGLLGSAASAALLAGVGIWHGYASTESAILAVRTAKLCLDNVADDVTASLKAGTYSTDEALDVLRRTTLSYASAIPGGAAYVERVFREVSLVRQSRGADVDKLLRSTHAKLNTAVHNGAAPERLQAIVVSQLVGFSALAGSSARDVVDRNPGLKPYREGAVKSLQGSPAPKVPTMKVNMTVKQRKADG